LIAMTMAVAILLRIDFERRLEIAPTLSRGAI
jgi:hypothetical protein